MPTGTLNYTYGTTTGATTWDAYATNIIGTNVTTTNRIAINDDPVIHFDYAVTARELDDRIDELCKRIYRIIKDFNMINITEEEFMKLLKDGEE